MAALVAIASRRLHVPYSVGLVATGMFLALFRVDPRIQLTRELIFSTLLPPLIFEAALALRWNELRHDLGLISVLATVGVVLSAAITAFGMRWLADWSWAAACLFGVLIAATDPVSVIALLKEAGVRGRLRVLIEAESLFNDGTAAVLFVVTAAWAAGGSVTPGLLTTSLVRAVGVGFACGAAVGGAILFLSKRSGDHLLELTFTVIAAYASFLLAEHYGGSGVLATMCAGLMIGNLGPGGAISPRGRLALETFWEFVAFAANSLIFLLIGIHEQQQDFHAAWRPAVIAIVLVMLARAAAVYPVCALFARGPGAVELRRQHLLVWGGLRGALALALALSLPPQVAGREIVATVSFAVVAFSIFAQGISIAPALRRWERLPPLSTRQ